MQPRVLALSLCLTVPVLAGGAQQGSVHAVFTDVAQTSDESSLTLSALSEPTSVQGDAQSLAGVVADYAARFERDYSAVVAEEKYVQVIHPWRGVPKGPEAEPSLLWADSGSQARGGRPVVMRRQLVSDVLLVQVAGQEWMAYRDVANVDGRAVRNREERMRALLLSADANTLTQLRRIADESARYNLGGVRRTMNLPNVALSFMRREMQERFRFEVKSDEQVGARRARVLAYRERSHETLVKTPDGRSVPAYGRLWIDAENGDVLRTELRFDRPGVSWSPGGLRSLIRVDFTGVFPGSVLLPSTMWEWYEGVDVPGGITDERSMAQGLATYGDYRRFVVTTTDAVKH